MDKKEDIRILIFGKIPVSDEIKAALKKLEEWTRGGYKQSISTTLHGVIITKGPGIKADFLKALKRLQCEIKGLREEGYVIKEILNQSIVILGLTPTGVANGIYDFLRSVRLKGAKDIFEIKWNLRNEPYFQSRDIYHFLTPWNLSGLSVDTYFTEDWKKHLEFIRSLNINRLIIDLWANQYYHPDYEETFANKCLYERLRNVFEYAHKIGLKTGYLIFPCQTPTFLWYKYPHLRAKESIGYYGIDMCWTKGKNVILPFDQYFIEYMGPLIDDCIIELEDPGVCLCDKCAAHFPEIVLEMVDIYKRLARKNCRRGRIELVTLHFRDWLENKSLYGAAKPMVGLREKVFKKISKDITIIDQDRDTLKMAQENGLNTIYFFFGLDPESGLEDATVFPRPKLKSISQQIEESRKYGDIGLMDYRIMPSTQFVADYVFSRKIWNPDLGTHEILKELGSELCQNLNNVDIFVKAIESLEDWWNTGQFHCLNMCTKSLEKLAEKENNHRIKIIRDCMVILRIMVKYLKENPEFKNNIPDELVDTLWNEMKDREIFRAYTIDRHWVRVAKETISQRVKWWLNQIREEVGGVKE